VTDHVMPYRVGLIVPSSNTTMETEIPAMLHRRETVRPARFTFHSSRMRMKEVTPEQLTAMDRDSDRCAAELADARVDVMAYACLVAIMAQGHGYHGRSQTRLGEVAAAEGASAPVVSSAGALVAGVQALGVRKIAVVAPYLKPLTQLVIDYLEAEGLEVVDSVSLEVSDNLEVGCLDPGELPGHVEKLDLSDADALVLSACVQMPSLASVQRVEDAVGLPVVTAGTATVRAILEGLDLEPVVPEAGALLAGA
jgi:maleate isomerase